MNILRFSRRYFAALLTIMAALSMLIVSTVHASEHDSHISAAQPPVIVPVNDPITIFIEDFAFSPNSVTVPVGTMVTWMNLDFVPHTSSSTTSVWNSGTLGQGQDFSFTFTSAGTFPYRCNIHTSMTASITVSSAPTATATATATFTPTATATNTPLPPRADTVGAYKDGVFYLRNTNTAGVADITAYFGGDTSDLPVAGDWNGDGVDTIGVYRNSTGFFFLSDSNTSPAVTYSPLFGNPGDTPFAGRWAGTMVGDGIGVYRNSNGILYQRKLLTGGFDDYFAIFGNPGDVGFAGDWDADHLDSVGIYRSSNGTWYLSNNSTPSGITFSDIDFASAINSGDRPVVGDWDADGDTTCGVMSAGGFWSLFANNSIGGTPPTTFAFGPGNSIPIAGKWTLVSQPSRLAAVSIGQPNGNSANPMGNGD